MNAFVAGLFLLGALAACSSDTDTITQRGTMNSGTFEVRNVSGKIEAYPPAAADPKNGYTISASRRAMVTHGPRLMTVCPVSCPPPSHAPATDFLVRVPDNVRAELRTKSGDIHVSDVAGPVDAFDENGDIKIQIPGYANAVTQKGNISVLFGDVNWPGDLRFSAAHGDVEIYVPATANAGVDLHTDHGIIFTDFDLHGTARGDSESISGKIGAGGSHRVFVRVGTGNIRMLRLVPQM